MAVEYGISSNILPWLLWLSKLSLSPSNCGHRSRLVDRERETERQLVAMGYVTRGSGNLRSATQRSGRSSEVAHC